MQTNNKEPIQIILNKFRKALSDRGLSSAKGIEKIFKRFDDIVPNKSQKKQELYDGLKVLNIKNFDKNDVLLLFNHFDLDKSGSISLSEFFRGIRGELNEARKKVVVEAFNKLDSDGNRVQNIHDIKGTIFIN